MAMVDELLYIKSFREQQAETDLQRSRADLRIAHAAEDDARIERDEFARQAQEDELRWYRELCEKLVRVRDIEDVQLAVAGLRQREAHLQQVLEQRERDREQSQQRFHQASDHLRQASTARSKFEELAREHHLAVSREAERKEEMELEELAGVVREREEWGGADE